MITPIRAMTINQIMERKNDLLVSDSAIKELARNERNQAIDEFAERLKQRVSRHYVDCDGYFGGILEEILYADYIDDIAEEMRGAE